MLATLPIPLDALSLDELKSFRRDVSRLVDDSHAWGIVLETAIDMRTCLDALITRRVQEEARRPFEGSMIPLDQQLPDTPNL